jgi:pyruvate dehydrogenase E1 component beta subunit
MNEATFREALNETLKKLMRGDASIIVLGETVATGGGAVRATAGLANEFGVLRVIETPVSENVLVGAGLGGALAGQKMMVEIYSADFLMTAASEVINDIAKWRYQHRISMPLNILMRMPMGNGGIWQGPEHSQCIEGYLIRTAGLIVAAPSTVADAVGVLKQGLNGGNPVVMLEHRRIYDNVRGSVLKAWDTPFTFGKARTVTTGSDITLVAWSWMRLLAEEAAVQLKTEGISVELIDPVTIKPMDLETIRKSLDKTGRLLIVEEAPMTGSVASWIIGSFAQERNLDKECVKALTMPDIPHPYAGNLETIPLPSVDSIKECVYKMIKNVPQVRSNSDTGLDR